MKRMTTLKDHERRITGLETKVREVDACHGESIYEMNRELVENRLGMRMIIEHLGLPRITAEQVDEVLDGE
jgi:uncharacterized coiled-coil protein SlyX